MKVLIHKSSNTWLGVYVYVVVFSMVASIWIKQDFSVIALTLIVEFNIYVRYAVFDRKHEKMCLRKSKVQEYFSKIKHYFWHENKPNKKHDIIIL